MKRLADAMSRLVRDHVDLAKAELREDARRYAVDAALGTSALPFFLAALLLFDVALALGLASVFGTAWAFALTGVLNLAVGGALGGVAAARFRKHERPLPETSAELQRNAALVRQLRQELRQQPGPLPPAGVRTYEPDGKGPDALRTPEARRDELETELRA